MPITVPTSARILINDWPALRDILVRTSTPIKERNPDKPTLLTEVQINDGFFGPFHPMVTKLTFAYALISKMKLRQVIIQDENIKPHVRDVNANLPNNTNWDLNIAALEKTQKQLDGIAQQQFLQWQELIEEWQQQLIMQLTFNGLNLSEIEITELSQLDPLYVLINRFTHLHLELPNTKNEKYSFAEYFKLKVILSIHSALSRQFKPHDMNEIEKHLKNLKNDFKEISEKEHELIEEQKDALDGILTSLMA